ncbi:hypothetical protein GCM10010495_44650 [Kitasatospora herbaricolor]|uniref:hypothetical protein n=1 Tax=Kitasatospora herbaricolor TaxID=68217 RepID=UPI00174ADD0E|nr:hypothetical protein [Kitasatospora herbaricolor]MDQ0305990.1 hypothetical protein [Kitasatospora herbaricolor]GGV24031.1 hypothetical protein GCM10010495_44650 [Kitasatospora herbaricolor]
MSRGPYEARFAREVGLAVRELAADDGKDLRAALEQATADPWSWPQADRYDLDDTVRVVTTPAAIAHYAILPEPPHLWVFAITVL